MNLNDSITCLRGVGEKRKDILERMNIRTIRDLIYTFPRKYEDRRTVTNIMEAPFDTDVLLEVIVVSKKMQGNPHFKKTPLKVLCEDSTGNLELVFFNAKYLGGYFFPDQKLTLYGKISLNNGRRQMIHPEFHKTGDKDDIRGLFPVYPLTEGLSQGQMRSMELQAEPYHGLIREWLPPEIVDDNNLCPPSYAISNIHFPKEERRVLEGRYRLIFEELLILQTGLFYIKKGVKTDLKGVQLKKNVGVQEFMKNMKFELTEGQKRAFSEIERDMKDPRPMNRLVQGDVGSGKTVVAEMAMYETVKCGYQAVMMAPTELLAKQHINTLKKDFEPLGIRCELLSGSMKAKERRELLEDLKSGAIQILVGTHAIIQPDVEFHGLGLVVTDEQHRFGVNQRNLLTGKGKNPNVLVMTATPIPRTLAVILFGDLDISVIDTLPAGRKPIRTFLRYDESRGKIYDFVHDKVKAGKQAYVVAPLIEESDAIKVRSADEIHKELSARYPDLRVGLVHGAMKQNEKDAIMLDFKEGNIDILVSTVVIEVGIDVPNATVMVIENCERFGLAQLHQLRGRVGRGSDQSYCILVSGSKSEIAEQRNNIMVSTSDGFVIAEEDLKLRGPGEIFGTRQHGIPELGVADLVKNVDVLDKVRGIAEDIIDRDPKLGEPENLELKERIKHMFGENISLQL
ncbi:MAG: ATP-dependent DNA helicase RecG [Firmicutes bacterium]|nr:ATP-dependent DNA helicase RecG [Bacillota bacterium]